MKGIWAATLALLLNGCASLMEVGQSQLEVVTLEAQLNRAAVGLGIVRENNMLLKMPISADAQWPVKISGSVTSEESTAIRRALVKDPYFATHRYTDAIQMKMMGGYFVPPMSSITESAFKKIVVLYGPDASNWPSFFSFEKGIGNLAVFPDGKPKRIEAISADVYPGLEAAVIALLPLNYRKDLETVLREKEEARRAVSALKEKKGMLESEIKLAQSGTAVQDYQGTTSANEQLAIVERQLSQAEEAASEKEAIVTSLLDRATEALQNDLRLDKEQVALAKNIVRVCDAVKAGAAEAGTLFAIAFTNIAVHDVLQRFPTEMKSLAVGAASVPGHLRGLYGERMVRLGENAVYLLPSVAVGSYEALGQVSEASRYAEIASIIVEAETVRRQQEEGEK